jgi:predicted dehydrogenase
MNNKTIKWGILGLGKIAHKFAKALAVAEGAQLAAVASRSQGKADAFAEQFHAPKAYGSYEALATDGELDIIYIATPHGRHKQDAVLCLEAGRNVLCEKAFALNSEELDAIISAAKSNDCFLMEAIWTRFHPNFLKVKSLIEEGAIGEPQYLRADFGFHSPYNEESRLWNPALGGGSLLDIGIYPLFLALQLFGEPATIQASAKKSPLGVDASMSVQLDWKDGKQAQLFSSFETDTNIEAAIYGPTKRLLMHNRWHEPSPVSLWHRNDCLQQWEFPDLSGYVYEIQHCGKCLVDGLKESPLLPLDFSKLLMRTMDSIRHQSDVFYPEERIL